jgi:hypothetical protein
MMRQRRQCEAKNNYGVSQRGMSKNLEDRDMTKRLLALLTPREKTKKSR